MYCVFTCIHCVNKLVYIYIYIYIYIYTCVCVCVCVWVYIYIYTYAYMYINVYIVIVYGYRKFTWWVNSGSDLAVFTNYAKENIVHMFKQEGLISNLSDKPQKLVDQFTDIDSSISSTKSDVNVPIVEALTAMDKWSIMWKYGLSYKI